jgi:hypothetical protein
MIRQLRSLQDNCATRTLSADSAASRKRTYVATPTIANIKAILFSTKRTSVCSMLVGFGDFYKMLFKQETVSTLESICVMAQKNQLLWRDTADFLRVT